MWLGFQWSILLLKASSSYGKTILFVKSVSWMIAGFFSREASIHVIPATMSYKKVLYMWFMHQVQVRWKELMDYELRTHPLKDFNVLPSSKQ